MNYVLDASVALKWVLPEADSDKARRLRDDSRNRVRSLLVPDFFPVEIAHALTRAERKKIIPVGYASHRVSHRGHRGPRGPRGPR